MRILCLHGMGTNSKIFQAQTAALRTALGEPHDHTFEFVEGSLPCKPAPEISVFLQEDTECFAYYDTSIPSTIAQAVNDLSSYVKSEGPFDGAIGFSQGAALIALLLARGDFPLPFSFAVFICGGPPFDEESLRDGEELRYVDVSPQAGILKLPTAHLIGAQDKDLQECLKLVNVCREDMRVVFDHGGGHQVPTQPRGITESMAEIIQKVMARASFAQ